MINADIKTILEYGKNLIKQYNKETDLEKKEILAKDIYIYYTRIDSIGIKSEDVEFAEFAKKNRAYYRSKLNKNSELKTLFIINEMKEKEDVERFEKNYHVEELKYISYLLKKIKTCYIRDGKEIHKSIEEIEKYINSNRDIYNSFKNIENDIWYNKAFDNTIALKQNASDSIILLNKRDISFILHEFIHIYLDYKNSDINITKYRELPSILSEVGICSYYDFTNKINRIKQIDNTRYRNFEKDFDFSDAKGLQYSIGFLISVPFIYENGNEFSGISDAIKKIIDNTNVDFENMLKLLGITERNIIDGFNNFDKVLKYKKY